MRRSSQACVGSVVLALTMLAGPALAPAGVRYELAPYSGFTPTAVNNHGVVVGAYNKGSGWAKSYHWSEATGRVRMPFHWNGPAYVGGTACDISDAGLACGYFHVEHDNDYDARLYDTNTDQRVTVHDNDAATFLCMADTEPPMLAGSYRQWHSGPFGTYYTYHASMYQSNGGTDDVVNELPAYEAVRAINADGYAVLEDGDACFLYTPDGDVHPLPELVSDAGAVARDMNRAEQIVGYANNADDHHSKRAVLWEGAGDPVNLGVLPSINPSAAHPEEYEESQAYEINRWGHVVGRSALFVGDDFTDHGFIYRDGRMTDLNDLVPDGTGNIFGAYAINDVGQIATNRGLLTPYYAANGDFSDGMDGWTQSTATGSVEVVADPDDPADTVLQLTTGSPVSVTQTLDTPDQPFWLVFDYRFEDLAGELTVLLDGTELLVPPLAPEDTDWHHWESLVDDESLMGLEGVALTVGLDSATVEAVALVDDLGLNPAVPDPATLALVALGGVGLLARRRKA